ncbi:hypothetical protein ACFX2I_011413 [Malus domestica]
MRLRNSNWVCEIRSKHAPSTGTSSECELGLRDSDSWCNSKQFRLYSIRASRLQVWLRTRGCRFDEFDCV